MKISIELYLNPRNRVGQRKAIGDLKKCYFSQNITITKN